MAASRDDHGPRLTVAVSGSTGLIGAALSSRLRHDGHVVRRLVRGAAGRDSPDITWIPGSNCDHDTYNVIYALAKQPVTFLWHASEDLEGCDAIVHLAGAPIAQRWSAAIKREIRESRVEGTSLIARTVAGMAVKPSVVVSGSAIGYYGDRGDALLDESSTPGDDFLSSVVEDWERAAQPIEDAGVRLVRMRTGIVLSTEGGALAKLLTPFRLGAGGPIGSGKQWMSWITLADQVRAIEHALLTATLKGPVNFVAPRPVMNAEFAATLAKVLHRPAIVPIPAFAVELLFGEMARATILAGQRVAPRRLLDSGFTFTQPTLEEALHDLVSAT